MERDTYAEEFRARILDPEAWKQSARHLLEAAALIEPTIEEFWKNRRSGAVECSSWRPWDDEFVAIYFMLCSFAIENFLKSQIVQQQRSELEAELRSTSRRPALLKHHDLYNLAIVAGFQALAKEEEMLLRRLTRSALWYGRYPVPVEPAHLRRSQRSANYEFEISLTAYSSADREDIRRIVEQLS